MEHRDRLVRTLTLGSAPPCLACSTRVRCARTSCRSRWASETSRTRSTRGRRRHWRTGSLRKHRQRTTPRSLPPSVVGVCVCCVVLVRKCGCVSEYVCVFGRAREVVTRKRNKRKNIEFLRLQEGEKESSSLLR